MTIDRPRLQILQENTEAALRAEQSPEGFWIGELSTSALSTATAVFTLHLYRQAFPEKANRLTPLIQGGIDWLTRTINNDGGWGDTVKSISNISTTCLVWSAFSLPEAAQYAEIITRTEAYIRSQCSSLEPVNLSWTIAERYGADRTFSVPILTMLALAGRLGTDDPWKWIPQLPFELAALPFWCFQTVSLPVVSYALPALIAIGQVRHHHRPTWNPITNPLRWWFKKRTLKKLRQIQPTTGGYLEATPLTSFVCMSLIGAGQPQHEVVTEGVAFLVDSVRPDGSWPIDTNLTTWVSTLSINALGENTPEPAKLRDWLLRQQYRVTHPYTMALPGGWAWTDLSGGVPDADDTPSALLALGQLDDGSDMVLSAARGGVNWLLNLQNRDGGIPTFCKGWGTLPFDRSSNDLTAHTVRAWHAWYPRLDHAYQRRIDLATRKALRFLQDRQNPDGSWAPLWFGNQYAKDVSNLTYGTSRVLKLLEYPSLAAEHPQWQDALARGQYWLLGSQNDDGGWGGRSGTPSSLEETALALEGLALQPERNLPGRAQAIPRGIEYLDRTTEQGREFPASPIGFYFANLWYFEKLYPLVFTVAALKKVRAFVDFQTSGIS